MDDERILFFAEGKRSLLRFFFRIFYTFYDTLRYNNKKINKLLQYVDIATSTPTWYCGKHDFCETAPLKELSNLFPEFIKNYCISQKA